MIEAGNNIKRFVLTQPCRSEGWRKRFSRVRGKECERIRRKMFSEENKNTERVKEFVFVAEET